jgi:tripartite-type tricarboxylate transporter receptor subunit TctC
VLAFSALSPLTLNPLFGRPAYDPQRDIRPVVSVMQTPVVVVATPAFAGASFAELIAAARAAPGRLRWASSGQATVGHMVLEQVRLGARVDITHVPYKGGGQQLNDALAGHFEVLSTNVAAAQLQHIRAGRFKPLAVGAPARLPTLSEVPTFAELGLAQANLTSTFGLFAPGGTPDSIVERVNAEVGALLRVAEMRERLLASNNIVGGGSTAEFARAIAAEAEANRRLVAAAGIRID